jgi:Uracil DNA glycosylase superfamily
MERRDFDPGPVSEPFATLARRYPGKDAYPPGDFRIEWGPVFHRGRLDGTARLLVLGQDPGQHESVVHRILVGEAGQRVQGFLSKLGIERSYVMVNAFLYSVYGQGGGTRNKASRPITSYRNKWLDALLLGSSVRAVVAFGDLADDAYGRWKRSAGGRAVDVAYEALPHPTSPEGGSRKDRSKYPALMEKMLAAWNEALGRLQPLGLGDRNPPLHLYGTDLLPGDRTPIPDFDLPAGAPPWWASLEQWATREAKAKAADKDESKRARIVIEVPEDERVWH